MRTTLRCRLTKRRHQGFSLLELLAVLAVLSLLATVAALTVRQPITSARLELAEQKIRSADQLVRAMASRGSESTSLIIDLDAGVLVRDTPDTGRVTISSGLPIEHVSVSGLVYQSGQVRLPFRSDGSSPSYAVRLRAREDEDSWLFVCGGTGQVERIEDETLIEELFN